MPHQPARGPQGPLRNAIRNAVEALDEFFSAPYDPARLVSNGAPANGTPLQPPLPEGDVAMAVGDEAISAAIQMYIEAGGKASATAVAIARLAGQCGGWVVVSGLLRKDDSPLLSVCFHYDKVDRKVVSMLKTAGFVRVVEEGQPVMEWAWA